MKRVGLLSCAAFCRGLLPGLLACAALAGPPPSYAPCAACHGPAGEGDADLSAPALAGQQAMYLARQLRHFRDGVRGARPSDIPGARMRAMALALDDAAIDELSQWLAALPPPRLQAAAGADPKQGYEDYQARCGACHGASAQGNTALHAPALASLDAAYLRRQFENFRTGLRGTHPDDTYGRQMKMMAMTLEDAALDDVIAFMHSQSGAR